MNPVRSDNFQTHRPSVTIITPTGARAESLARCREFVSRFRHTGSILRVQWLVVDDGPVPSTGSALGMEISRDTAFELTYVRPDHTWQPGMNTLALNLLAAIPKVQHALTVFIEDDDWYSPEYLWSQVERLQHADIAGEIPARYYHLPSSRYWILENSFHASLCQTAIRSELLTVLRRICEVKAMTRFIDVSLWNETAKNRQVLVKSSYSVGMKGLPGREGIGVGHRPQGDGWRSDSDKIVLRSWIGDDIAFYDPKFAHLQPRSDAADTPVGVR